MRPKLTAWLLATLVVLASGWNVPVATGSITQSADSTVWLARVSERSTVTAPRRKQPFQRLLAVFSTLEDCGHALGGLNRTVFQLPPPTAFLARV